MSVEGKEFVQISQPRLKGLLAYLLLSPHTPVPRKQLSFLFWPDSTDKQAQANLRKLLYQLRRRLPQADAFLSITTHTVDWELSAMVTCDVASFEENIAQAKAATSRQMAQKAFERAVTCYTGDLLPEFHDDWIINRRRQLRAQLAEALQKLAELAEDSRDYGTALGWTQRLLKLEPLQERPYRHLIKLHLLKGERAKALSIYHLCAAMLRDELGVEPSPETEELRKRVLRLGTQIRFEEPLHRPEQLPLVGRDQEWQRLLQVWRQALNGKASLFLVQGEGGIGKTKLVEELVENVRRQGLSAVYTRAYEAGGTAVYGPIVNLLRQGPYKSALETLDPIWLTEIARLLPDLLQKNQDLPAPAPIRESWQQHRFQEALARGCLTVGEPLLLHFDDLQWCDEETLNWLKFLLEFFPAKKLLVVGTVRDDEIDETHPLSSLQLDLQRQGRCVAITLNPLQPDHVAVLASHIVGETLSATAVDNLFADTEGSPLFVVEMLRAREGAINDYYVSREGMATKHDKGALPSKVQAVIKWRLDHLSPLARQVAEKAAVFGRSFTLDYLLHASQESEDQVFIALDELWRRRIIREKGADEYDFSHDRIREVAYHHLSPIIRRHWHQHAAETLKNSRTNHESFSSDGQIASHYEQAGQKEKAADFYQRAAEQAIATFADKQAATYITKAYQLTAKTALEKQFNLLNQRQSLYGKLLEPDKRLPDLQKMQALAYEIKKNSPNIVDPEIIIATSLGTYYRSISQPEKALTYLQEAISLAQMHNRAELEADAQSWLGSLCRLLSKYELATAAFERCLHLTNNEDQLVLRAHAYESLPEILMFTNGTIAEIEEYLQKAFVLYQQANDISGLARIYNKFGYVIASQGEGNYTLALNHYQRSLKLVQEANDRSMELVVIRNLIDLFTKLGDYAPANVYLQRGIQLNKKNLHHLGSGIFHSYVAFYYLNMGQYEQFQTYQAKAFQYLQNAKVKSIQCKTLSELGLFHYLNKQYSPAIENIELSIQMAREIREARQLGYALVRYGLCLVGLADLSSAKRAFHEALEIQNRLGLKTRSLGAIAGLADVAMKEGDQVQAVVFATQIFDHLQDNELDKTDDTLLILMSGFRVFQSVDDAKATRFLRLAHRQLQKRAETLEDHHLENSFWSVPLHAEIDALYQQIAT